MIACPSCDATYDDDQLGYCGRCGSDLRRVRRATREGQAMAGGEAASLTDGGASEDGPVADPMIGRVIDGRYRVLELLGVGGMGAVYKVEHTAMGKIAALKMLHPTLSNDREVVRRFRREAEAVARLDHPCTVQVFDFGASPIGLYMVMEYIRGEDLGLILRRDGRMGWSRAAPLLLQICDALTEAHAAGIIHRDLKPENVLVARARGGGDAAKVVDFGLAKLCQRDEANNVTARGSLVGTPFYMSPEQIRSEELDPRSDIYSFGAMMYRMLTGEPPFAGPTPLSVVTQHLVEPLVPPSQRAPQVDWDPRVEAIILRCMAKERDERFADVPALRAAIDEARVPDASPRNTPPAANAPVERRTTESLSPGRAVQLRREDFDRFERQLKIRRWVGLAILPLVLLGGAAGGWALYHHERRRRAVDVEIEPNDNPGMANLIAPGRTVRGTIGKRLELDESDRDFFQFHVAHGPSLLRVELSPIPNMDLLVELFDAGGARLVQIDNAGPGEGEVLPNQRLAAGDYYLEVREVWVAGRQATEDITDRYTLLATVRSIGPDEESEPDDTSDTALPLRLDHPIAGYLSHPNDVDFFYPLGIGGGTLSGEVTGIDGVDVRLIVLPPGVPAGDSPAKVAGARIFDAGGPGQPERFADLPWLASASAPRIVVERKDRPPPPGRRGPSLIGIDSRYTLTVERRF